MLLRVRLPSGVTKRVEVADDTSQATLEVQIQELAGLDQLPSLFTDPGFTRPFALSRARHGDIVYVHRTFVEATEAGVGGVGDVTMTDADADASGEGGGDKAEKDTKTGTDIKAGTDTNGAKRTTESVFPLENREDCCGSRGMCPRCAPLEDKEERYRKEVQKWKGRGMSLAVMEALEALKPKVKPQESAHVTGVCVDSSAGHTFQAYLGATGFSQHRFGVCFGTVGGEDGATVEIHAIYEPPQNGDDDAYALDEGCDGAGYENAVKLATLLGLQMVGVVFSARQRKAVLSGRDVVVAARYARTLPEDARKHFVVIKVGVVSEAGETAFESYQISDLAIELAEKGTFADEGEQKPNSGKVLCAKEVLVEGRDTKKVHTEFFLNNVPIRALDSWLRCEFPVENRQARPQKSADIAAVTGNESVPYWQRLSDFHLLLFLTGMFGIDGDMPAIVASIRDKRDIEEGYKIMIQSMAAS